MDNKEKMFCQLGVSLVKSKEFTSLSAAAQNLYIRMMFEAGKSDTFSFPWSKAQEAGMNSRCSFDRWKKELITAGFIEVVEKNQNLRQPNLYRFCIEWKKRENGIDTNKI